MDNLYLERVSHTCKFVRQLLQLLSALLAKAITAIIHKRVARVGPFACGWLGWYSMTRETFIFSVSINQINFANLSALCFLFFFFFFRAALLAKFY